MPITSREAILQNIECRCEERIGFNFDGGRRDDISWAGVNHGFKPKVWIKDNFEYSTDIWGNVWHRIVGLSQGGEIFKPVLESWDALDSLVFPDFSNPAFYQGAREILHLHGIHLVIAAQHRAHELRRLVGERHPVKEELAGLGDGHAIMLRVLHGRGLRLLAENARCAEMVAL